jgi:hypothetical protein
MHGQMSKKRSNNNNNINNNNSNNKRSAPVIIQHQFLPKPLRCHFNVCHYEQYMLRKGECWGLFGNKCFSLSLRLECAIGNRTQTDGKLNSLSFPDTMPIIRVT